MGLLIDRERFEDSDYQRFGERLSESLPVLEQLLARPGFGEGEVSVGAEIELFLVDRQGYAAPSNLEVKEACQDPRLTVEITRYNLELNLTPAPLAGRPFTSLMQDSEDAMRCVRAAAAKVGTRPLFIGILPTLRQENLGKHALTPLPRYHALNEGIRRNRKGAPLRIAVAGEDSLHFEWSDVSPEGANTSMQFHLRVLPRDFARFYNAAQLATAPVLALAGNAPFFLGRRLWDETRVALFRQATDDRGELPTNWAPPARVSFGRGWCRQGALELFAEAIALHAPLLPVCGEESPRGALAAGRTPQLEELRLHNGTVWLWNRPVYDPVDGGHLRIEFRALPAGPSNLDMAANGAFLLGLTLGLAPHVDRLLPGMPFVFARENFYRAAKDGVDATLLWPHAHVPSPRPTELPKLLPRLLELSAEGLERAGVTHDEYAPLLELIRRRAESRLTGARWQRRALAAYEKDMPRADALSRVLEQYLSLQEQNRPVHAWPVPG